MNRACDLTTVIAEADSEFPALFQLFGGYFHQDWLTEYASPSDALTAYLEEAPPQAVRESVSELQRLLQLPIGDDGLGRLLREGFGCNYVPRNDGLSDAEWLSALRDRLRPSV